MPDRRGEAAFWGSVALRLLLIAGVGWASVLWFRGCLMPALQEEVRQNQQKVLDANRPRE